MSVGLVTERGCLHVQAYRKKYHSDREMRAFAPESLREMAPAEKVGEQPAAYIKIEGALGRQMVSNLKRPRPLMDLDQETAPDALEVLPAGPCPSSLSHN